MGRLEKRLQEKPYLASLEHWINTQIPLSEIQQIMVQQRVKTLQNNVAHCNETDLSMHFIGHMFSLTEFTQPYHFNLFTQAIISGIIQTANSFYYGNTKFFGLYAGGLGK